MFTLKVSPYEDLAIDIGTGNTLICDSGGILLNEPSIVAVTCGSSGRSKLLSVGREAKLMVGKSPSHIRAFRPMRDGVIADYEIAELMMRHYIRSVLRNPFISHLRILLAVPSRMSQVEARAFAKVIQSAGAREIYFIKKPVAAAIGAGLPVMEPWGSIVVDIGAGVTEIAVISMGEIVCSRIIPLAGRQFDSDIIQYIKRAYGILIGEHCAEEMKFQIGNGDTGTREIKGMDLLTGIPGAREIRLDEVRAAMMPSIETISEAIQGVLWKCPPELAADILTRGIVLSGGCALIEDIPGFLSKKLGLPVVPTDEPLLTLIRGAGLELKNVCSYQKLVA